MSRYLTDLADVVRAAGLTVVEVGGWETRARSSGGFADGQPCAIVIHHTASGPSWDGQRDADYIATGADIAPIAQLYLDRKGQVWVCAAGACNNAGKGGPKGAIPLDGANTRTIGIEAGNNGLGEPWPEVQQDAYVRLVRALCDAYGIAVADAWGHMEWAPTRKIDPAGQSNYATGSRSWDMDQFRQDVEAAGPPQEGDTVTQGEAYDTLTLFYSVTFPDHVGEVAPSADPGKVIETQQDLYDTLALWHTVNPGLTAAINRPTAIVPDGDTVPQADIDALYRQVDSLSQWWGLMQEAEWSLAGPQAPQIVPRPAEAVPAGPLAGISANVATQLQTIASHVEGVTRPLCRMHGVPEPLGTMTIDENGPHYEPQPWW